ncbi:MAG: methyltransferase, partial [Schwartzia sp.]|nr:methyltransferase [Schwartzia sp. (in: firmicutes)]
QLAPKRMRLVEPRAGKSSNLVLIEAVQGGAPGGLAALPTLRVYDEDGAYTPELLEIYGKH